ILKLRPEYHLVEPERKADSEVFLNDSEKQLTKLYSYVMFGPTTESINKFFADRENVEHVIASGSGTTTVDRVSEIIARQTKSSLHADVDTTETKPKGRQAIKAAKTTALSILEAKKSKNKPLASSSNVIT